MINNKILIIGDTYIKDRTPLMENVESQFIKSSIHEAQNIEFQSIICDTMYEKIISQMEDYKNHVETGGTQPIDTFVEQRFLDLLEDYGNEVIMYYALYHASYHFHTKLTNKGIVNQYSDNSNVANRKMVDDLRKQWKNVAENYVIKMTKFLEENITLYPEYQDCSDCDNDITRYAGGLYLGKSI